MDPTCSDRLGGMTITTTSEGDEAPVTTLVGRLSDQAALMGVLNTLYDTITARCCQSSIWGAHR